MNKYQLTFAITATLSALAFTACGSKSSSTGTPLKTSGLTQQQTNKASQARLSIVNPEALKRVAAAEDGNPEFYLVQGQPVERDTVDKNTTPGLVACMTKLTNFEFQKGDLATPVTSTPSMTQNQNGQIYMNVIEPVQQQNPTQLNAQAQQQSGFMMNHFQIICLKAGSAITPTEISAALQNVVLIR